MSRFKTKKGKGGAAINTSSLPDIIFMLLFFFMVTTVLRETDILVEQQLPRATQLSKLEKKSLVSHLYIGKPKVTNLYGNEPKIQADDVLIDPKGLILWISKKKDLLDEVERDQITISLKIDEEAKMGIVSDVQQQLREANARKIMYATPEKLPEDS